MRTRRVSTHAVAGHDGCVQSEMHLLTFSYRCRDCELRDDQRKVVISWSDSTPDFPFPSRFHRTRRKQRSVLQFTVAQPCGFLFIAVTLTEVFFWLACFLQALEGPMALLRSFHARHLRIHVSIRRSHGLRSILSAYILAFDKHWNLLLLDVDEHYTEWEWRLCGKNTVATLQREGVRFQLPGPGKRQALIMATAAAAAAAEANAAATAATSAMQDTSSDIDAPPPPNPRTYVCAAALAAGSSSSALLPTPPAFAAALASSSSPPVAVSSTSAHPPAHIRVESFKQRHMQQLYVRGDSVVSVCQFSPTLHKLEPIPPPSTAAATVSAASLQRS